MYFFDYFFYRVSSLVKRSKIEVKHPEASGGPIVTLFQMFNLMALGVYLHILISIELYIQLYLYIGIPLFIINWIFFFNRKTLNKFRKKWGNENKKSKQIKGVIIVAYMLLSIFFFSFALNQI